MLDREKIVKRATQLGFENTGKYWGCAQSTFAAIVDTFREEGIPLCSKEAETAIFKGVVGLSGGHANMGKGNCGALTGAAVAISLASNVGRADQLKDRNNRWIAFDNVGKTIAQDFINEFRGLTCRDVTWKRWGKWWDSWNPEAKADFSKEEKERGCLGEGICTISMYAGKGAGYIVDIINSPRTLEQVMADHDLVSNELK